MRELNIGNRRISDDTEPYIVAEIGSNHCGDIEKAKQLIIEARNCGVDAVKLQKRTNKDLYTDELYNAPYANINSYGPTYGLHREALEFDQSEHHELKQFSDGLKLTYFATAFDFQSADDLMGIGVPAFKIASGDIKNTPLIKHVSAFGLPVIISTGGCEMSDIYRAVNAMNHSSFALLHCVASYPNKPEEMNLLMVKTLRDEFPDTVIGLSDHYNGICMSFAAYVLGARIFEKHFTLNHTWKGTDHALSLQPEGMRRMVRDLKRIMVGMGDGVKRMLDSERGPISKMAKGLYWARDMDEGEIVHAADIAIKSPENGVPPYLAEQIIGLELPTNAKKGQAIGGMND